MRISTWLEAVNLSHSTQSHRLTTIWKINAKLIIRKLNKFCLNFTVEGEALFTEFSHETKLSNKPLIRLKRYLSRYLSMSRTHGEVRHYVVALFFVGKVSTCLLIPWRWQQQQQKQTQHRWTARNLLHDKKSSSCAKLEVHIEEIWGDNLKDEPQLVNGFMHSPPSLPLLFVCRRLFGSLPHTCLWHVVEWQLVKNVWAVIAIYPIFPSAASPLPCCYHPFAHATLVPLYRIGKEREKLNWEVDLWTQFQFFAFFVLFASDQRNLLCAHHNLITEKKVLCVCECLLHRCNAARKR